MMRRFDAAGVAEKLSAIPGLSRDELIARWEKAHGRPAPKGISRRLLDYSAAYQAQAKVFGGLTAATKRKLRRRSEKSNGGKDTSKAPAVKLSPGTRLVREWQGKTHHVEVTAGGFLYDGGAYGSLSHVARVITGARWSGPRFFGL